MDDVKITYYPHPLDDMWNKEAESLIPYCQGYGLDVGASNRSIFKDQIRVDIDPKLNPDYVCSAYNMPFKDQEFDFCTLIHVFEHFEKPLDLIAELTRVIQKGGIIAIVHPDVDFTGVQRPEQANPKTNPHNKHYFEYNLHDFVAWFKKQNIPSLKIIDSGVACPNWSFYVIIKKI